MCRSQELMLEYLRLWINHQDFDDAQNVYTSLSFLRGQELINQIRKSVKNNVKALNK